MVRSVFGVRVHEDFSGVGGVRGKGVCFRLEKRIGEIRFPFFPGEGIPQGVRRNAERVARRKGVAVSKGG
jgi:hypothetical protein